MRVLIAPDSFKGTASGPDVAAAIATGWRRARPGDEVVLLPLADGGEGTLDVIANATPGARRRWRSVRGPDDRVLGAPWLLLPDGTAVVELAAASGLPLMRWPEPLGAHTFGFGQLLDNAARDPKVRRIVAALGGSASTDGGTGALAALGTQWLDAIGLPLAMGGRSLADLASVDVTGLRATPPDGVELLVDVHAPLLGNRGAARQFGPQKGASPEDVTTLEAGLTHLADVCGVDPSVPGSGAAGGTAYGLMSLWGARLTAGSTTVGELLGLADAVAWADVVITGEGQLDEQSTGGKVVGHVPETAAGLGTTVWGCVGRLTSTVPDRMSGCLTLTELAGSPRAAMQDAEHWLEIAGSRLAAMAFPAATSTPAQKLENHP